MGTAYTSSIHAFIRKIGGWVGIKCERQSEKQLPVLTKKKRWVTLDLRLTTYTNITVRSNQGLPGIYRRFLLVVERKYIYRRDWFVCFLLVLNTAATVRVISERSL